MRPLPYVGVAGVMSSEEIHAILATMPAQPERKLGVGLLASRRTILGDGNAWPHRYPRRDKLSRIFVDDPRCLNLVHYGQSDDRDLFENLCRAYEAGGPFCHGVQVNVAWPDRDALRRFAELYPRARVVLQMGPKALASQPKNDLLLLALSAYSWCMTDVLLDSSAGEAKPMNAETFARLASAIRTFHPMLGVGIAGALGADKVSSIAPILLGIPDVSTDAESRLREETPLGGHLDVKKASAFVGRVLQLHRSTT